MKPCESFDSSNQNIVSRLPKIKLNTIKEEEHCKMPNNLKVESEDAEILRNQGMSLVAKALECQVPGIGSFRLRIGLNHNKPSKYKRKHHRIEMSLKNLNNNMMQLLIQTKK